MTDQGHPPLCEKCGAPLLTMMDSPVCGKCLLGGIIRSKKEPDSTTSVVDLADVKKLFPEFEVISLLGAGAMGAVYQVRQPKLDRVVAIKIMSPSLYEVPAFISRFEREARAMARLDHPNIVKIYDFGERNGFYYFVMEYVDGSDLRQLMADGGLEKIDALELIPQICEAIQFAHNEGICHRDIKPANILLSIDGRVKITDFGIAKFLTSPADSSLTATGTTIGTFQYMAPERLMDGETDDKRCDVYSLGVVLYQLLTGQLPQGDFPTPSETLPRLNPNLNTAVMKALARDPAQRFGDVTELFSAIDQTNKQKKGSKSMLPMSLVIATLLIAVAAIFTWLPSNPEKEGGDSGKIGTKVAAPARSGKLSPIPLTTRPGRMRIFPMSEELKEPPVDLSAFEGMNDLVQVIGKYNSGGQCAALRANGETVTTFPSVKKKSRIHRIGQRCGPEYNLIYINQDGIAIPAHSWLGYLTIGDIPQVNHPVIDVAVSKTNGLLLLNTGEAVPWGHGYDRSDLPWPKPDPEDLANVRAIATGSRLSAVLKIDGSVLAWGESGELELPVEFDRDITAIGISDTPFLLALSSSNELWVSSVNGFLVDRHLRKGVIAIKGGETVSPPMYQTGDGDWHLIIDDFDLSEPKIGAALTRLKNLPAEAFYLRLGKDPSKAYLLWIEP